MLRGVSVLREVRRRFGEGGGGGEMMKGGVSTKARRRVYREGSTEEVVVALD